MSVVSFITRHLPGAPEGNPDALRAAASTWTSVANGLSSTIDNSSARIGSLGSSWQGEAKTAFEQEWHKLTTAIGTCCEQFHQMSTSLNKAADQLEAAQSKYAELLGAAAIAGFAVTATVLTAGASDVVAADAIAAGTADAVAIAADAAETATSLFSAVANVAEQMAARFVVAFGADLVAQGVLSTVLYPDHDPFGHLYIRDALGTAAGFIIPDAEFDGVLAKIAGKGAIAAGNDALSQEVSSGKIDPVETLFSGLQGAAGAAGVVGFGAAKTFAGFANEADEADQAAAAAARDAEGAGVEPEDSLLPGQSGDPLSQVIPENLRPQNPRGDYTRPSGPVGGSPGGTLTQISKNADASEIRGITGENDAAQVAAAHGYDVVQNPSPDQVRAAAAAAGDNLVKWDGKRQDMLIGNRVFDAYTPEGGTTAGSVAGHIADKVDVFQTQRVIVNLQGWKGNVTELEKAITDNPIAGLKETKLILPNGNIVTWSASMGGWTS